MPWASGSATSTWCNAGPVKLPRKLRWRRLRISDQRPLMSSDDLERARGEVNLGLKSSYGRWLLLLLAVQLVVADVLMFLYASRGEHWKVPGDVMKAWLAATVVQLIGIVYVVVSHLFPKDSK